MTPHNTENQGKARRRTRRPLLWIPIEVEGKDASGRPFAEKTHTIMVNRNGARIALKQDLKAGDRIIVTNLQREESCPFRVVERTKTLYGKESEWGVECLEPDRNFWGIYFPEGATGKAQGDGIDVLLECANCRSRELVELSMDQYRELSTNSAVSRPCRKCGGGSDWEFGFAEVLVEQQVEGPYLPSGVSERRTTKRFVAMLPLRLRNSDGEETVTRTENLSKLGLCFRSDVVMESGDLVFLSVGPNEKGKKELPVRVAWRRPMSGSNFSIYGVRLEEEMK
jgi:PilZ domain